MEYLFLIGRIIYGGFFIMNGFNHVLKMQDLAGYAKSKGVPAASLGVIASGLMIFTGGAGIVLGAYTKLSVLLIVLFLVIVSFQIHNFWTIKDPQMRAAQRINFEKNMALAGAAMMFLMIPEPWPFGL